MVLFFRKGGSVKRKKKSKIIGTSVIALIILVSAFRGIHKAVKKNNEKKKQNIVKREWNFNGYSGYWIEKMNEIVLSESGDELKILGENFKIRERDYARKKENDIFVEEYYGKSEIEQNGNKIEARIIKSDYYNLKDKKDKNNEDSLKINLKKENSVCETVFDFKNKNIISYAEKELQSDKNKKGNNLANIKQDGILEKKEKLTSKEMENELEKFLETKDNVCGKFLK